jgi:hypothetical protein
MKRFSLESYEASQFLEKSGTKVESSAEEGIAFASLSPFDIPTHVGVEVISGDRCVVQFGYINNEPPESTSRVIDSKGTEVLLGDHSKKIIAVMIPSATQRFSSGKLAFDQHDILGLALTFPVASAKVCARSAVLINAVLESMPRQLRSEIQQTLVSQGSSMTGEWKSAKRTISAAATK